jgi:hypothetical protein
VVGLSQAQLDTKYRNWTIRQIVHHVADSHMNSYIRFKWVQPLRSMTDEQFARCFVHPETKAVVSLADALCSYAWHRRHHTGQILWLREQHRW